MVVRGRPSTFGRLIRGLVLIIMVLPAAALAGSALPRGFVYLRDIDPTIVQDVRYAGSHNFVGRPIKGYLAAECILSVSAAKALETVQRMLTFCLPYSHSTLPFSRSVILTLCPLALCHSHVMSHITISQRSYHLLHCMTH